jgi:hypothetical protein
MTAARFDLDESFMLIDVVDREMSSVHCGTDGSGPVA